MTTYYAAVHDGRAYGIGFDAKGARKDAARRCDMTRLLFGEERRRLVATRSPSPIAYDRAVHTDFDVHEITLEQCKRIASANEAPAWPLEER